MKSWKVFLNSATAISLLGMGMIAGSGPGDFAFAKEAQKETRSGPIAVFPFEDLSGTSVPFQKLRNIYLGKLKRNGFAVTEDEAMEKSLAEHRVRYTGGIDLKTARAMKLETGAEAILLTTVGFYSAVYPPKFALLSRLVSTETLEILWMDTVSMSGDNSPGLLGLGLVRDHNVIVEAAIERLMKSLSAYRAGKTNEPISGSRRNRYLPETQYRSSPVGSNFKPHILSFSLPEFRGDYRSQTAMVEVSLGPSSDKIVTVDYGVRGGTAINGMDYRLGGGTLTFSPGERKKNIRIEIAGNSHGDRDKTVVIGLANPENAVLGGCLTHTYVIPVRLNAKGDKSPGEVQQPSVAFERSEQIVVENSCGVTAKVVLSSVAREDVSVPFAFSGTASEGVEFRVLTPNPMVIKAGTQETGITLSLIDDDRSEEDKILKVALGTPVNASPAAIREHTITIKDDDRKPKIAVIPFYNNSSKKYGGEILALHFVRQLVGNEHFRVIEPGEVRDKLLGTRIIMDDGISLAQADVLFEKLDADFIITGRVLDYMEVEGAGGIPLVDFSVLAIARKTSAVIWYSGSRKKGDKGVFFFNWGMVRTANELAELMVSAVVREMFK